MQNMNDPLRHHLGSHVQTCQHNEQKTDQPASESGDLRKAPYVYYERLATTTIQTYYIMSNSPIKTFHHYHMLLRWSRSPPYPHPHELDLPHFLPPRTCRGDTMHLFSAICPRTPCGRNGCMAAPEVHRCRHTLPSKCSRPAFKQMQSPTE